MKPTSRLISAVLVATVCLLADDIRPKNLSEVPRYYTVVRDATLSGAAEVVTIQQPATGASKVRLLWASVYCSVACDVTQERNGTAATTTAATAAKVNPDKADSAAATVFHTSNVGVGTVISKTPTSGGTATISFDKIVLVGDGTTKNYTIRTSSITGRVVIVLAWEEYN